MSENPAGHETKSHASSGGGGSLLMELIDGAADVIDKTGLGASFSHDVIKGVSEGTAFPIKGGGKSKSSGHG
jgi:hypothetical protein